MPRSSSTLLALLVAVSRTFACEIPVEPLSNTIAERFSIVVQNPAIPRVHNYVMNFRANGDDEHLVLRPDGVPTGDTLWLENGVIRFEEIHAVIDLEYNPEDDTTKMFMTARDYHPSAIFQPVYACDPDTDELQIRLALVSRLTDPPVLGGQMGIRETVGTYEFRYTPPNNPVIDQYFLPVNMVIFRDGLTPTPPTSTRSTSSTSSRSSISTSTRSTTAPTTPTSISTLTRSTTAPSTTPTSTLTDPGDIPPVGDYDFVSCRADPTDGRALPVISISTDDMTNEKCATFCAAYPYFGTQWSRECSCGTVLTAGSTAAPLAECSDPCTGDASQMCGGSRRLSLYHNGGLTGPSQPAAVGDYESHGCVTDSQSARTLTGSTLSSSGMTLEMCATFCSGYTFFGAEYGIECWCGNSLTAGATTVDGSQCSMTCGGNGYNLCGHGDRLSVYQLAAAA